MLSLPSNLLDKCLVIDVRDPDKLGSHSTVKLRFPADDNAHRYRPLRAARRDSFEPIGVERFTVGQRADAPANAAVE